MGVIDDLVQARATFERREWVQAYEALSRADESSMLADDFTRLATAAFLLGQKNDFVQAMQRAYKDHIESGEYLAAVDARSGSRCVLIRAVKHRSEAAGFPARNA